MRTTSKLLALAVGIAAVALTINACTSKQPQLAPSAKAPETLTPTQSHSSRPAPTTRTLVTRAARARGWIGAEWQCLDQLIWLESSWDPHSKNPQSSAYGLFQILKLEPGTAIPKQIERGIRYIAHRYQRPCLALEHLLQRGWY